MWFVSRPPDARDVTPHDVTPADVTSASVLAYHSHVAAAAGGRRVTYRQTRRPALREEIAARLGEVWGERHVSHLRNVTITVTVTVITWVDNHHDNYDDIMASVSLCVCVGSSWPSGKGFGPEATCQAFDPTTGHE